MSYFFKGVMHAGKWAGKHDNATRLVQTTKIKNLKFLPVPKKPKITVTKLA